MTGADDPAEPPRAEVSAEPPGPEVPAAPRPAGSGGGGRRVGGWILVGIGGLFVVCAIALAVIHLTQRNSDGYYTSDTAPVVSRGYAVTSEKLDLGDLPSFATDAVGRVRISGRSHNGKVLFVGIAPESAVNGYLGAVARNVVTSFDGSTIESTEHSGGQPSRAPGTRTFWQASGSGRGQVTVTWKIKGGSWAIVVMNANGSRNVSAGVSLGAKTNLLLWIALGCLVFGAIAAGGGAALLRSGTAR